MGNRVSKSKKDLEPMLTQHVIDPECHGLTADTVDDRLDLWEQGEQVEQILGEDDGFAKLQIPKKGKMLRVMVSGRATVYVSHRDTILVRCEG